MPVFGLLKRDGKVYTVVIPNAKALLPIIRGKVYRVTDTFRSYNALDVSEFKHFNHSEGFAAQQQHVNGIENFWNQAKRHSHLTGSRKRIFIWKECEWRFNNGDPKRQLSQLKQWVKRELG